MGGSTLLVYIIFCSFGEAGVRRFPNYDVDCNCKKEQVIGKKGMCRGACICVGSNHILYTGWNPGYAV